MRCTFKILCDEQLAGGFAISGLEPIGVGHLQDAVDYVSRSLQTNEREVVIVADELFANFPAHVRERAISSNMPIFVPMPLTPIPGDGKLEPKTREFVSTLLQRAIGKRIEVAIKD